MIDFGKTTDISDLVEGGQITHEKPWELGNYEDGYFFGLRNLLTVIYLKFVLLFDIFLWF